MKLSYNWLTKYVDIKENAEDIAKVLTMSGSEVEAIAAVGKDTVMDLEITSNRPDCLNIVGLAREVAAVLNKELKVPRTVSSKDMPEKEGRKIECVIKNKELCKLYTARVITGVTVKGTSREIKGLIESLGMRSVNNIVDITNFCLMETGQPLHAFDLDKIKGNKIIVREARKNEKLITIDGVERILDEGMLVIADERSPIAIAGVMGGKDTEVTENTKNILLESAYFDPISIRQTSRKLALSSDSSYRFERGVDKGSIETSSNRACKMILAEAGGCAEGMVSAGRLEARETEIIFDIEKAGHIIGVVLQRETVMNILTKLGMKVSSGEETTLKVTVPSFREDITSRIDLVEEVARIYGYEKIPETITQFTPQVERKEKERKIKEKIYAILPALGLSEIMTYSLISESAAFRFPQVTEGTVQLMNPLSEEQKVLTPQLLDGMLKAISWNINRKNKDLGLFELGKIYSKGKNTFNEVPTLCMAVTGELERSWLEAKRGRTIYDLKGVCETLFLRLKINAKFTAEKTAGFYSYAQMFIDQQKIGFLGELNGQLLKEYDIEQPVYICQIELTKVVEKADLLNRYRAVSKEPVSKRDISILCNAGLSSGEICDIVGSLDEKIIRGIELVDVYTGEQIPEGQKSLTYSVQYGAKDRTLTEEEIERTHNKIKDMLAKNLQISFR